MSCAFAREEHGREDERHELIERRACLTVEVLGVADGDTGHEGAEDGVDADPLGEGCREEAEHGGEAEDPARPARDRLDPG
jgi:hypothetical protein